MFDIIMSQIFDLYLNDNFEGISSSDWEEDYKKIKEFEEQHKFSISDCTYLEADIINSLVHKSEMLGFSNGFKLAVRLLSEIRGNSK